MNFLTIIKSAFVFVSVNPFQRLLVDVSNEKTFDYGALLGDNVRVAETGGKLLKVFEAGWGCRERLAGYFIKARFVRQGSIDKEMGHLNFTRRSCSRLRDSFGTS